MVTVGYVRDGSGAVRYGRQGEARLGGVGSGLVCRVEAGMVRQGRHGCHFIGKEEKSTMVYQWSNYNYKVKAQVVGEEIEKIKAKEGAISSEIIVKNAKSANSPLHPLFEWNDTVAADKFRKYQANQILHCLVIVEEDKEPTRAFVNIESGTKPGQKGLFLNIQDALTNENTREVVLRNAYAELIAFKQKYAKLSELAKVIIAIDEVISE